MPLVNELITELKLDSTKFTAQLASAKTATSNFSSTASIALGVVGIAFGLATTAAGIFYHELDRQIEKVDELAHSAEKFGISLQAFQSLKFAAEQVGVSIDSLKAGAGRMSSYIQAANLGAQSNIDLLKTLGLSAKQLSSLSVDKQLEAITSSVSKLKNVTEQRADIKSIFGRGGLENMPLFISDIKAAREEYEKLNIEVSDGQAKQAEAFVKTQRVLGSIFTGFKEQVGAEVAPAFTELAKEILSAIEKFGGVRAAARSMAVSIIDAIIGIEKGFETFEKTLDSFISKMHVVVGLGKAVAERFGQVGNALVTGDPRMFHPLDAGYRDVTVNGGPGTAAGSTDNSQKQLTNIRNGIASQLDSVLVQVPEKFRNASDAVTEFGNITKKQAKKIADLFGEGEGLGTNYLQSILTKTPQAQDSTFTALANEVKEGLMNNSISQGRIDSDLSVMQKIAESSGGSHIGKWNGSSYDTYTDTNSGMLAAVKELQAYVKDKKGSAPEVKLSVEASKDFIVKVANDSYTQSTMAKVVLSIAEKEAINTTT